MHDRTNARSHAYPGRRRITAWMLAGAFVAAGVAVTLHTAGAADQEQIARGKYLASIMGCADCHTPGHFFGKEDPSRYLGGSDVGFAVPGLGVFVGPNLTPDDETGLGKWTEAQIVAAITKGETPEGRMLAPAMPWRHFASANPADVAAIAAFLKSMPPVKHQVPGPFGPTETPTTFVMSILPGAVYANLPHPPAPGAPPPK